MTHENNQSSDDLDWMKIAREDAITDQRPRGKRLPFIAAVVSLGLIGAGAVFAQTSNEPAAQADVSSTVANTQTPSPSGDLLAPTPSVGATGVPTIPNAPSVAGRDGDDEFEERDGHHGDRDRHGDDDDDHGWNRDRHGDDDD